MLDRRSFLRLATASIICDAGNNLLPTRLFATSDVASYKTGPTTVPFTVDAAKVVATNYLAAFSNRADIKPSSSNRLLDTDQNHIGYIIWLERNGAASGYMVLDATSDGLLTDFSLSPNATPLDTLGSISPQSSDVSVIKKGPIEYTVNASGLDAPSVQSDQLDCVTVAEAFIRKQCTVNRMNHWQQFIAYDDSAFMAKSGKYACMVCSLFACAENLGLFSPGYILPGEFNAIWNATSTKPLPDSEQDRPGITQGETDPQNGTYGFQAYARSKGRPLNTNYYRTAAPGFFSDCIDRGGVAVAHIRLHNGTRHAVAVEGYVDYTRPDGVGDFALIVYDAHKTGARYIQFANTSHIQGVGASIYG